ncbi:ISXO2-like transposase domain-containing protein [Ditylenchus destructor]|uniref:ISXO2-like transposase domain-containing protein n=1 Tax=Ditylenchus destructor TaxID=166010 RepID=A0AAD4N848_9BILA|nr:ISXO2-like transposase domain-containing protein [Ditylenchus destructor]
MSICYSFALEDSYDRCIRETFDFKKVASATRTGEDTIAAWYKFCSEMVDGSQDFRLIVCPNNCRSAAALLPIIQQHIAPGTTIRTDMWKAYDGLDSLPDMNYTHEQVNHSDPDRPFVSEAGVHTNRVESSWRPAKDWFRKWRGRQTCGVCRNMWNILCASCKTIRGVCVNENKDGEKCKEARRMCQDCLNRYRSCNVCYDIKWGCQKCHNFRQGFAEKMVLYQWRRWCRKNNRDPFEQLLKAIAKYWNAANCPSTGNDESGVCESSENESNTENDSDEQ